MSGRQHDSLLFVKELLSHQDSEYLTVPDLAHRGFSEDVVLPDKGSGIPALPKLFDYVDFVFEHVPSSASRDRISTGCFLSFSLYISFFFLLIVIY